MTAAIAPSTIVPAIPLSFENRTLLNLLIVDDDRFVREACRDAAVPLGYRTSAAQSSEQALWLIDSQMIDVVLLGLNLPNVDRPDLLGGRSNTVVQISRSLSSAAMPRSIRQCRP